MKHKTEGKRLTRKLTALRQEVWRFMHAPLVAEIAKSLLQPTRCTAIGLEFRAYLVSDVGLGNRVDDFRRPLGRIGAIALRLHCSFTRPTASLS